MVKKHIYHFSRGMVIGFEAIGVVALTVFIAWLFLIIRLSQGPLNVDFLTKNIESAMNSQQTGFVFHINSTVMSWGGSGQPFEFEMQHVQIDRTDNTPVLTVEKIGIQLSKRRLVFGQIMPRVIKIYSPALRIVRGEDGHFTLNMGDAAAPVPDITAEAAPPPPAVSQVDFIKALLLQMNDTGKLNLLGGLRQVSITDAALLYEDKILQVGWKSRKADVKFTRGKGGLIADVVANLELGQTNATYVRGSFYYSWQTHKPNGVVYFTNFNPSLLAQQSEQLKDLSGLDMPFKGSIALEMDQDFNPGFGRFVIGAAPGKFNMPGLYPEPIAVEKVYAQGRFNAATKEALLEQFQADLKGPKIEAKAVVRRDETGHVIAVNAALLNMPMDKLAAYWPETLTPDPRNWVTKHLSAGTATKATLSMEMLAPEGDFSHPQLRKLGGGIDFTGIKVDYFPPLLPVTKVNGKATYDRKSFNLDIAGGTLNDMPVSGAKIAITDLDIQNEKIHSKIDIDVSLGGPLRTALKVLDSEPLKYPQKLGIQTADVAGDADVNVNFKFPLHKHLAVEDVKVSAKAKLNNVLLKGMVGDFPLSGGPMALSIDNGAMTVKGKGRLDTMPVEFNWLKNFSEKAEISSKVEAQLPLDGNALVKFGVPGNLKMSGTLPSDVTYTVTNAHTATLLFKGDITPFGFTLPVANYEKTAGMPGTLDLFVHFWDGKPVQISSLNLTTEAAQLKGNVDFLPDGKTLKRAVFDQIKLGDTDIALSLSGSERTGYNVKVSGQQFDASQLLKGDDKPNANSDEEAARPVTPLVVSMAVNRLVTGKDKYIDKIRMYMSRNTWSRIEHLEVTGVSGGKPVNLRYMPTPKGHTLKFEADNAGAALSALGITNGVRGGKIVVTGLPQPQGGMRDLQGSVALTDFSLVNVPVLGMLLNSMSLVGIVELLNGKGIAFKKMRSDFWWIDKGQPENAKNTRIIKIKNGQTSGASLGLTFEGTIDKWTNRLDINGTIIPVSDISKVLSAIPLVGDILTGGGGGVFAATYEIKGPTANPNVSVNPLSVLAPGILRKLFFEK